MIALALVSSIVLAMTPAARQVVQAGPGASEQGPSEASKEGDDSGRRRNPGPPPDGKATPRLRGIVSIGRPDGDLGGYTADQLLVVLKARQGALRNCYERELERNPAISGKLVLKTAIQVTGRVGATRTMQSTLKAEKVEACVKRVLATMQFPTTSKAANVNLSLIFASSS